MARFAVEPDDKCFVHVATWDNQVMKITAVHDGVVPRYDLIAIDGTELKNIGEYELEPATIQEVIKILRGVGQ